MKRLLIGLFFFFAFESSWAGPAEMNGIKFEDFGDFYKSWNLVTVRFRRDTGEQRLTYANEKAWAALKNGAKTFPDGAVFAKIGMKTEDDPSFVSSAVPSGPRRYQFMVKDASKFKETDGWGYALFDSKKEILPEDPRKQTIACHACHKLVPERDFVFSEPMTFAVPKRIFPELAKSPSLTSLTFEDRKVSRLSLALRKKIPLSTKSVRSLEGPLRKNVFQGTLDEVRPLLAREAFRSKKPAVLVSQDGTDFSAVYFDPTSKACSVVHKETVNMMAVYTDIVDGTDVRQIREEPFCGTPGAE